MSSRIAWPAACSALALLLGGCGDPVDRGGTKIEAAAAADLAARSDEIARLLEAGDTCTAADRADELRERINVEVSARTVPVRAARVLVAEVDALVDEVNCNEARPPSEEEDEGKKKHKNDKKRDKKSGDD